MQAACINEGSSIQVVCALLILCRSVIERSRRIYYLNWKCKFTSVNRSVSVHCGMSVGGGGGRGTWHGQLMGMSLIISVDETSFLPVPSRLLLFLLLRLGNFICCHHCCWPVKPPFIVYKGSSRICQLYLHTCHAKQSSMHEWRTRHALHVITGLETLINDDCIRYTTIIIIIITVCSYISATSVTFIDKSTNLHHGGCLTILCQLTVLAVRACRRS